ncbi:phospholipid transporting ATPase [Phlyctochytrium planicorne]|nr:phospholipid transporting ATPase [Phlyctochytrium planicorne]
MVKWPRASICEAPARTVLINQGPSPTNEKLFTKTGKPYLFPSNTVRTTKYTPLTFIFKNIYEQFRRVANLFFLCLVILQFFPEYQTINPLVAAIPLTAVVFMTAVKDAIEDLRRHKSDVSINSQGCWLLAGSWENANQRFQAKCPDNYDKAVKEEDGNGNPNPELWRRACWGSVKVGDIVFLKNDDAIPADLVILSTSEPECLCYVETKNLDGETNLKIRKGLTETAFLDPRSMKDFEEMKFWIESEPPNSNLFSFKSTAVFSASTINRIVEKMGLNAVSLAIQESVVNLSLLEENMVPAITDLEQNQQVPLNMNGYLLRGCVLRNTKWVIGVVTFTGVETKICLNAGKTPFKQSRIDVGMNNQV